ncbi:MAG: hypothetical protein CBC34_012060 [Hyphomicrobiaceae bacterium TMED74]|nr:hypothetical protein [Filomicrobium sp.]RPG40563.1 MAG: hypothetical protein CBC34_012060 [Hyphomicrobiaceae bacterium TMED74]
MLDIHNATMQVLEEIGIDFLHDKAVSVLRKAGCKVDENGLLVRIDQALVREKVPLALSQFTMIPRNPDRQVTGRQVCNRQ